MIIVFKFGTRDTFA